MRREKQKNRAFEKGLRDGIPIGLGYLSVSFSFGLMAVRAGLPAYAAVLISATNLTSAGQVAGLSILTAGGAVVEMILTQLVINMRYALMGVSLSQKTDASFTPLRRAAIAFGITDEVFAVASSQPGTIGTRYMSGLLTAPFCGWVLGTLLGALAGDILPEAVKDALGIAIYGMFIAIVVPSARCDAGALLSAVFAALLSCLMAYLPALRGISQGFSVVICACLAAAVAAWLHPLKQEEAEG